MRIIITKNLNVKLEYSNFKNNNYRSGWNENNILKRVRLEKKEII